MAVEGRVTTCAVAGDGATRFLLFPRHATLGGGNSCYAVAEFQLALNFASEAGAFLEGGAKGDKMASRIGITVDLVARRAYWEQQFPKTFRNWQVVDTCYSKSQAQARETLLAKTWGCESHADGDGSEVSTWYAYYFQHDGR